MNRLTLRATLAALALGSGLSCLAYNEECSRYMNDPDGIAGWLSDDVKITKPEVRTKDNAVGQLVAEAYYHAFDGMAAKYQPNLALVNGGAIRGDGVCETREALKKGAVKRKVLRDVLPFDNQVQVVVVSQKQLKNMLEHAYAGYSLTDPKGAFLQLYGAEVWVDCTKQAEKLGPDKARITEGQRVTKILIRNRDGTETLIPVDNPSETATVQVALDSFLAGGGDDFIDLKAVDPNAEGSASAGSFNFEVVAAYFASAYPEGSPLSATAANRVHLEGCK